MVMWYLSWNLSEKQSRLEVKYANSQTHKQYKWDFLKINDETLSMNTDHLKVCKTYTVVVFGVQGMLVWRWMGDWWERRMRLLLHDENNFLINLHEMPRNIDLYSWRQNSCVQLG